jgi:hypothetical protein
VIQAAFTFEVWLDIDPSFRLTPESSVLMILFSWTPAPGLQHAGAGSAGVTNLFASRWLNRMP